jgi:uncharacterized protein (TIGR02444 family)
MVALERRMGSPFWNFSVAVYGAGAVQDECLDLQDQFGLDVNLILLCAFLGAVHGVTLISDDIAAARREVEQWQKQIVRPLRAARRSLKAAELTNAQDAAVATQLRAQVKAAELESEHIEQMMLDRWAEARLATWPRGEAGDTVVANLQILFAAYGIGRERLAAAQHIIAAALDRAVKK